jgi:hypothetical protein
VDVPPCIRDIVGASKEKEFLGSLDALSEEAFDDQCTGANPRYPLISDLRAIYTQVQAQILCAGWRLAAVAVCLPARAWQLCHPATDQ